LRGCRSGGGVERFRLLRGVPGLRAAQRQIAGAAVEGLVCAVAGSSSPVKGWSKPGRSTPCG
jgi:hypothetical protein